MYFILKNIDKWRQFIINVSQEEAIWSVPASTFSLWIFFGIHFTFCLVQSCNIKHAENARMCVREGLYEQAHYPVYRSMSDTEIHIRPELSLALIVNSLLFLSVPAGTCVRGCLCVCVCVLASGGQDWQCGAALQTSSLATCLTATKNTFHSYDPYIYCINKSSWGHTSKPANNYLRQGSVFTTCWEYPIIPWVRRGV